MAERTLALIKSHAVEQAKSILDIPRYSGLLVHDITRLTLTHQQIMDLYGEHYNRPYWKNLYASVSGEVVAAVLESHNAVLHWRALMGATDPLKAVPGTLRYRFGNRMPGMTAQNAVHGSDSAEAAKREIAIVYGSE